MESLRNACNVLELLVLQGRAIQLLESGLRDLQEVQELLAAMQPSSHNLELQRQEVAWLIEDISKTLTILEAEHDRTIRELHAAITELDATSMHGIAQVPHHG